MTFPWVIHPDFSSLAVLFVLAVGFGAMVAFILLAVCQFLAWGWHTLVQARAQWAQRRRNL